MNLGLLLTALGLGLRHGIDWDHIAAIADLTSTAETRKRGIVLSMLYAVGHGAVVFALGILAIIFGLAIPEGADEVMGQIVGVTLIALGAWILVELIRKRRDFRLRSRWMLVFGGTFRGLRRVRDSLSSREIAIEHEHGHAHDHAHDRPHDAPQDAVAANESRHGDHVHGHGMGDRDDATGSGHTHAHRHELSLPTRLNGRRESGAAAGVGMLHGVGIESPTQIAIFVASSAAVGFAAGITLLAAWVIGLIVANLALALLAGAGILNAERSFPVYATLAVVIAVLSIGLGIAYLFGLGLASPLT